jgi:hypothetical protein
MKYYCLIFLYLCSLYPVFAQFPPAAGQTGTTAIHAESSCFIDWAMQIIVERGYVNIADTGFYANGSNIATYGNEWNAVGKANNEVVSLGDKGYAVATFQYPIMNGDGWDFAVFENALNDTFLELAFVEVSSDGVHFFRFPAVSLTQTDIQTSGFGLTDPVKIHNLAGKYRAMYGTPFDLDDIEDNPLLDKNYITHVKIIDVGGSIHPDFASLDSQGNIINDPFPTPFHTGGFDLDAVGVIYNTKSAGMFGENERKIQIYPNPTNGLFRILTPDGFSILIVYDIYGIIRLTTNISDDTTVDITNLPAGLYLIELTNNTYYRFKGRIMLIQ